jgi:hypothetical protein
MEPPWLTEHRRGVHRLNVAAAKLRQEEEEENKRRHEEGRREAGDSYRETPGRAGLVVASVVCPEDSAMWQTLFSLNTPLRGPIAIGVMCVTLGPGKPTLTQAIVRGVEVSPRRPLMELPADRRVWVYGSFDEPLPCAQRMTVTVYHQISGESVPPLIVSRLVTHVYPQIPAAY